MKLLKDYVSEGGHLSEVTFEGDLVFYNIDTGMKADMRISPLGNHNYAVKTRYDEYVCVSFENVKELVEFAFDKCMCGRDYCSYHMEKLAKHYGVIEP